MSKRKIKSGGQFTDGRWQFETCWLQIIGKQQQTAKKLKLAYCLLLTAICLLTSCGVQKHLPNGDTTVKGFKSTANYQVHVTQTYIIKSVQWRLDTSVLKRDILSGKNRKTYFKPNQQYSLDNIKAERERYDLNLKNKGYYFFNSD